jgi:GntR family transcriptional repressor for pyruvate dehydrogenase complex
METVKVRPTRKVRAYEEIVRQLESLIQKGKLKPGDRLASERDLADQFGVSRVTVRQALSVLRAMGLVESLVGDGTFARRSESLTVAVMASYVNAAKSTLLQQLELRRVIEPEVARLAAERATPAQLREIFKYTQLQQRRLEAGLSFVEEDSAFHLAIAKSSGNDLLVRMIQGIHELLRGSREESLRSHDAMERSLVGHQRITDAIRLHDPRAAHRAMLRHVLEIEMTITDWYEHHPEH